MNGQKFPRSNSRNRRSRGRERRRENINQISLFRMSDSKPNGNGRYSESEAAVTLSKMKSSNSFSPSFILPWPPNSHVPSLIELRERRRFHSRIPPPTPLARSPAQLNFGPNLGGRPKRPSSLVDRPLGPCAYEVYSGRRGVYQK